MLTKADGEQDADERRRLLRAAEDTLLADYPIAPLYYYVSKHLVADHVAGFADNTLDRHPSRFMSFRSLN